MTFKSLTATVLILGTCHNEAYAQQRPHIPVPQLTLEYHPPPLVAVPSGDDSIKAIRKGENAPFSGQLLDTPTALRWAHYLQQADQRLKDDVIAERKVCNSHLQFMGARIDQERGYSELVERDLRARILELEQQKTDYANEVANPPFYKSFWFGALVGVLGTSLVAGLGVWAGVSLRP